MFIICFTLLVSVPLCHPSSHNFSKVVWPHLKDLRRSPTTPPPGRAEAEEEDEEPIYLKLFPSVSFISWCYLSSLLLYTKKRNELSHVPVLSFKAQEILLGIIINLHRVTELCSTTSSARPHPVTGREQHDDLYNSIQRTNKRRSLPSLCC